MYPEEPRAERCAQAGTTGPWHRSTKNSLAKPHGSWGCLWPSFTRDWAISVGVPMAIGQRYAAAGLKRPDTPVTGNQHPAQEAPPLPASLAWSKHGKARIGGSNSAPVQPLTLRHLWPNGRGTALAAPAGVETSRRLTVPARSPWAWTWEAPAAAVHVRTPAGLMATVTRRSRGPMSRWPAVAHVGMPAGTEATAHVAHLTSQLPPMGGAKPVGPATPLAQKGTANAIV